jgi:hypothetical protein
MEQGNERRPIRLIEIKEMNVKKIFFVFAGFTSLALGVLGLFLPLLPTTPLVILSAACFSKSNRRLEAWLERNRVFGPFIANYRTKRGISLWHKIFSVSFLWAGLITSMVLMNVFWMYIILTLVGIGVTIHILMIKTSRKD